MTATLRKTSDQHITFQGTWEKFKLIQQGLQESPGIRLAYCNGAIEILMPGEDHEYFSRVIHYLVTTFLLSQGIPFKMTGAKTQEKPGKVSAQADESFWIGTPKPIPDLSIEVIFTSGGNKLGKYQALGVPEVWLWQDGLLTLHHLRSGGYEQVDRSQLPGLSRLDINLLQRCILIAETDFSEAVQVFQQAIEKNS